MASRSPSTASTARSCRTSGSSSTEVFEGIPDGDSPPTVNTATFTEVDGRTRLEVLVQCPDKALRDIIIDSGMEGGMQESMDALEQVAISLQ